MNKRTNPLVASPEEIAELKAIREQAMAEAEVVDTILGAEGFDEPVEDLIYLDDEDLADLLGKDGRWNDNARYVYEHTKAPWFFWDDTKGRWQQAHIEMARGQVRAFLREVAADLKRRAEFTLELSKQCGDPDKIKPASDIFKEAMKSHRGLRSAATINKLENLARSNKTSRAEPSDFDQDRWLLGTPEGALDLRTCQMREHRREDLITRSTTVAPDFTADCPLFMDHLNWMFRGDQEVITFAKRYCGYCLTGDISEQIFWFLLGPGGDGKGTLTTILAHILGDYYASVDSEALMRKYSGIGSAGHKDDLASLDGARLVVTSEINKGVVFAEGLLKDVTGGNDDFTMMVSKKGESNYTMRPQFKIIMPSNTKPELRDTGKSMLRRLRLSELKGGRVEDQQDKRFHDKLRAEAPAILAWMVEGLREWHQHGMSHPQAIKLASAQYLEDEDDIGRFLAECCVVGPNHQADYTIAWENFRNWTVDEGVQRRWAKRKDFTQAMNARGFAKIKSNSQRFWSGFSFKAPGIDIDSKYQ